MWYRSVDHESPLLFGGKRGGYDPPCHMLVGGWTVRGFFAVAARGGITITEKKEKKSRKVTHRDWLIATLLNAAGIPTKGDKIDMTTLGAPECAYVMGQIRHQREPLGLNVIELGIQAGILKRYTKRHEIWEVYSPNKDRSVADGVAFASAEFATDYCMGLGTPPNVEIRFILDGMTAAKEMLEPLSKKDSKNPSEAVDKKQQKPPKRSRKKNPFRVIRGGRGKKNLQ